MNHSDKAIELMEEYSKHIEVHGRQLEMAQIHALLAIAEELGAIVNGIEILVNRK